jgi:hypothetical protein
VDNGAHDAHRSATLPVGAPGTGSGGYRAAWRGGHRLAVVWQEAAPAAEVALAPAGAVGAETLPASVGDGNGGVVAGRREYPGPLLPLIWRSMLDLGPSFRQFASGLKARAEC